MLQKYGSERLFSKYDNSTKTILKTNPTKKTLNLIDFLFAIEHSILKVLQENKSLEKHFDKFF